MPNFDGRGPRGGNRQGRGLGPCGNEQSTGRRGFFHFSRFFNHHPFKQWQTSSETQISFLEEKLESLEREQKILIEKIEELKRN